jgi:hypothetical protein
MSKIDEIKQMIEIRYADLKELDCYSPETVLILLEQLRPYVELVEEMNEYSLHRILSHHGYSLFADMFKQIKEQK